MTAAAVEERDVALAPAGEIGKGSEMPSFSEAVLQNRLVLRQLEIGDYHKGYLELLGQLTTAGSVSEEQFNERFAAIQERGNDYYIVVVEDLDLGKIVATGTLFVEYKFLRGCGKVGHVEDVVVDSSRRGANLGKRIVTALLTKAKDAKCYKVTLYCKNSNLAFYEKLGFQQKEVQAAIYNS